MQMVLERLRNMSVYQRMEKKTTKKATPRRGVEGKKNVGDVQIIVQVDC